jgi:hypothetical protein
MVAKTTIASTAIACAALGFLAGCSSPTVVTEKDGTQTTTADKPEYNKSTGFYEYEKDGKKVQINKDDVHGMEEVK